MRSRRPWPATSRCRTERDAARRGNLTVVDGVSGAAEPDEARSVIRHARRRRRRSSTAHCIFGGSAPRRTACVSAALPTFSFFPSQPPSSKVTTPASVSSRPRCLFLSPFLRLSLFRSFPLFSDYRTWPFCFSSNLSLVVFSLLMI